MSVDAIIDAILLREGGKSDRENDRGGPTNFGVTLPALAEYWKFIGKPGKPKKADLWDLEAEDARELYRALYIDKPRFDEIENPDLQELIVDCGIHHGRRRAARWLQKAAGVYVDGLVGPITLDKVNQGNSAAIYYAVVARRIRFIGRIITDDPTQVEFAAGWNARAASFVEEIA